MTGALLLVAALSAVTVTGYLLASCVAGRSVVTLLLGVGVIGYGVIVGVAFVLSVFGWLGRTGFLVGLGATLALALVVWNAAGRSRPPLSRGFVDLRETLSEPALAVLAALAGLAWIYTVVLALATPQLDWDSVAYHLPRAALWLQQHGIGEIPGAADVRLSWAPPGAEIVVAFTMAVARSDRYVALAQLTALPLAMVAVAGTALRLGLDRRAAAFGGLVFACLPIVFLQAPTTFNDLVVAALLLAAFCLLLGTSGAEGMLAALAIALALLTKLTAALALPLLVVIALAVRPRAWRTTMVSTAIGTAVGGVWYLVTLARTGSADGGWGKLFEQEPDRAPLEIVIRAQRFALDLFDLTGFAGDDRAWLPIAAAVLAALAVVIAIRDRTAWRTGTAVLGAATLVAVLPWLVDWGRVAAARGFGKLLVLAGHGDRLDELASDPPTAASPFSSGFGVVFALVWVTALVVAVVGVVRRRTAPTVLVLLLAPTLFAALFAIATVYDGARGRFFVFPVGLAAAMFGLLYPVRIVRLAVVPATAAALLVAAVHAEPRPLGLELLEPVRTPAVWNDDRFEGLDEMAEIFDSPETWVPLERTLADERAVAVATRWEFPLYPLFGADNSRRVVLVRDPEQVPENVRTLLVTEHGRRPGCGEPWRLTQSERGWYALYSRSAPARCAPDDGAAPDG